MRLRIREMRLTPYKFIITSFVFALLILFFSLAPVSAQTQEGEDTAMTLPPCAGNKPFAQRNLDEILCLEDGQRRSIRMINAEMKEQLDTAQRRMQFARRALDHAVYGETISDEATIEQRAREVGMAMAEFARVRALIDLKIRRVLTPEQVKRFLIWREMNARREERLRRALQRQNDRQNVNPRQNRNNFPIRQNNNPNRPQATQPLVKKP